MQTKYGGTQVIGTLRRRRVGLSCVALGMALAGLGPSAALAQSVEAVDDLPNPPELRSVDGVLRGTLTVAPAEITVRGRKVVSNVINGNYMAPTLRVRPGDVIRLKAVNEIGPAQVNI